MEVFNRFCQQIRVYAENPEYTYDTFAKQEFIEKKTASIYVSRRFSRFSPQDLMALRRAPTRPLGKMPILGADISVIVSEEPLEPVTATPADEEAISKVNFTSTYVNTPCRAVT